jgi:hypothetical protein
MFTNNNGDLVLKGDKQFQNVRFRNRGNIYKKAGLDGTPGTFIVAGEVIQEAGNLEIENGVVQVTGDFTQGDGTTTLYGTTLSVTGALAENGGTINLGGGYITAAAGFQIALGALLAGSGSITADVVNNGYFDVGGANAIGTVTITGSYTQSSTGVLNMEIASTGSYDTLAITGAATLGGILEVKTINSFAVNTGQQYSLITYSSRSGTFTTTDLTEVAVASGVLDLRYDDPPNTVTLWVIQVQPA